MTRLSAACALAFLVTPFGSCDSKNTPVLSQEDKNLLDKVKAKERVRAELESTPGRYIEGGDWDRFDKGLVNSYTRATAIEFANKSPFDVVDPEGNITYIGVKGDTLATVPFHAEGEVRGGTKTKLKVTAGEVSGTASRATIYVTKVHVRG